MYRLSNEAEDFERIVRRFAALVLCECRRVTGNIYDAEDASQMVFLALAMEIKSGSMIRQPGAWLKRVARRQALKVVRSRTRRAGDARMRYGEVRFTSLMRTARSIQPSSRALFGMKSINCPSDIGWR